MSNFFTGNELDELHEVDIRSLVASRLEDLADRVEFHAACGDLRTARLLRDEGLELAETFDTGRTFFYVTDLTTL